MTDINQLYDLMPELIEAVKEDGDELIFTSRAKEIIKEITEYARSTRLYNSTKERGEEFWQDPEERTAKNVYCFMLDRIIHAPTAIHRNSSIILHIPVLDDILNGGQTV